MVTQQQYQQQLQQRRITLESQARQIQQQQAKMGAVSQRELRTSQSALQSLQARRQKAEQKKQVETAQKKVQEQLREQSKLEQQFEAEKKAAEAAAAKRQKQYELAVKVALGTARPTGEYSDIPAEIREAGQKSAEQLISASPSLANIPQLSKKQLEQVQLYSKLGYDVSALLPSQYQSVEIPAQQISGITSQTQIEEPVTHFILDPTGRLSEAKKAMESKGIYKGTETKILTPYTVSYNIGKTEIKLPKYLQKIQKEEGIIPPTVEAVKYGIGKGLEIVGNVGDIPIYTQETPVGIFLGGEKYKFAPSTIGKGAERVSETLKQTGEIFAAGLEDIIGEERLTKTVPEETKYIYGRSTLMTGLEGEEVPYSITIPEHEETTALGLIPAVARVAPETIGWLAAPYAMAGVEVLTSAEQLKTIEKDAEKILSEQYKAEVAGITLEEGYRIPTEEEFITENKAEVIESLRSQALISGGLSIAFLGGAAAGRIRSFFKPVVYTRPGKAFSYLAEVQVPREGKIITDYRAIAGRTGEEAMITSKFRETFNLAPKMEWTPFRKPIIYMGRPVYPIVGNEPYTEVISRVTKRGFGKTKLFGIGGKAEVISQEELTARLKNLAKPEQYTWYKGMFKQPSVIQPTEEFSHAAIGSYEWLGRLGRRTRTFYAPSRVTPLVTTEGGFGLYKTETFFKETTKPLYRAAGKIQKLPGRLIKLPEQKIGKAVGEGVEFFGKGPKTTQVFEIPKPVQKIIPKIPKAPSPKVITEVSEAPAGVVKLIEEQYPTYVGGTKVSSFISSFEKTAEKGAYAAELITLQVPGITEKVITIQPEILTTFERQIPSTKQISFLKTIPSVKIIPSERQIPAINQIPALKEVVALKIAPSQKQIQRAIQRPVQKKIRRQEFVKVPKPKERIIRIPKPSGEVHYLEGKKKKKKKFIPLVRRYGEFIEVGKPTTFKKAFRIGLGKVQKTLAATLQIKEARTGKLVPIAKETRRFRPGKKGKDIFQLVQKAPFRLEAPTEIKEIIAARKVRRIKFI